MHKAHINTWHIVYISYLPATEHTHRACLATQSSELPRCLLPT